MNFYIAKLVFRIEVLNGPVKNQYEEKLIWIKARDFQQAYAKCVEASKKDETEFINANEHHLRWKLEGITHLSHIGDIADHVELFSEIREDYTESENNILQRRVDFIKNRFITIQE